MVGECSLLYIFNHAIHKTEKNLRPGGISLLGDPANISACNAFSCWPGKRVELASFLIERSNCLHLSSLFAKKKLISPFKYCSSQGWLTNRCPTTGCRLLGMRGKWNGARALVCSQPVEGGGVRVESALSLDFRLLDRRAWLSIDIFNKPRDKRLWQVW